MHAVLLRVILVSIILTMCVPWSLAVASEQRMALVIGNSAYSTGPLRNPVNDAADMAAALQKLGFEVILKKNATLQEMEEAVFHFADRLKKGGVGLFYFAGHGVQVNGENYLLPVGANISKETDVKYKAVNANRIMDEMAYANNGLNVVLLDACRDNPFARTFRSTSRGLAIVNSAPAGTFISFSTGPGQVARDGEGRNSPYTAALLKYMQIPGLTISDVFINVRTRVKQETGQIPWELSSLEGQFYFVPDSQRKTVDPSGMDAALEKQNRQESETQPSPAASEKPSAFTDLKKKMEERRERENQLSQDFEAAKKLEKESLDITERIQVWKHFTAALPDERTARIDELRKYAMKRIENLERYKATGQNLPREMKKDKRFIAYDDGTVLDTKTNLMWAAKDNGSNLNWTNAKAYCENYRGGGYSDWRMPTQTELSELHDAHKIYPSDCRGPFGGTWPLYYATDLIHLSCMGQWAAEASGSKAAYFHFNVGVKGWAPQSDTIYNRALPVRSAE